MLVLRRQAEPESKGLPPPQPSPSPPPADTVSLDSTELGVTAAATTAALKALILQQGGRAGDASSSADGLLQQLQGSMEMLQSNGAGGHSFALLALITPAVMAVVAAAAPRTDYDGYTDRMLPGDLPSLSPVYSVEVASDYFRRRPVAVAQRAAKVAAEAAHFGASLLMDIWTGRLKANEAMRAEQLRAAIERLGPAYIKVAQAVSTRADLLTPAYFAQIQLLQDRVPPFPCALAKAAMSKAFGRAPEEVFSAVSERPVAAASLGQVYRATLKPELGGGEVAVKVLRPGVLEQVRGEGGRESGEHELGGLGSGAWVCNGCEQGLG